MVDHIRECVAGGVRAGGRRLGLIIRELASVCAGLGAVWLTEDSLANVERGWHVGHGPRKVSVEELMFLARALRTTPADLAFGVGGGGDVRVAGCDVDAFDA